MAGKGRRIRKSKVLITGGAGSIGSELARQLHEDYILYVLDINEMGLHALKQELNVAVRVGDIRNRETLRNVFDDFRPHIVFHAAAYKSVDMLEYVPEEAIQTNVIGTLNMLDYARIYEVEKFIFVSTDKVVNAKSIMGKTKSLGETMTVNLGFNAVRFGNVLGSRGSLLEIWERQINNNEPLTITDEQMKRYFMTIPEAVDLMIKALEIGKPGEILCFEMGKPIKIKQLAERLIEELGRDKFSIRMIGNRGGESLEEQLMTEEERRTAIKRDKFYVIK